MNLKTLHKMLTTLSGHPKQQNCPPPTPAWCKATVRYRKISLHYCCTTAEFAVCVIVAI